jgi:N utilization substance protein B
VTARHIARELAVIVLPQLSKKTNFEEIKLDTLIAKTVSMLCDYAKHNLTEADALLQQSSAELVDAEVEHPDNAETIDELKPVQLTSEQLKKQVINLQRAVNLIAEALDVPALSLQRGGAQNFVKCEACGHTNEIHLRGDTESDIRNFLKNLLQTYWQHREEIDRFIKRAKSKWQVNRMVSIDRDILRLACAEAFFMPEIPISVCINEAVELCHRFADDKAAKFINGVLGDLAQEARYFRNKGVFPEELNEESPETDSSIKPNGKSQAAL